MSLPHPSSSNRYRVYRVGGRRVLAVADVNRRFHVSAVGRFPTNSFNRRIYRSAVRLAARMGVHKLISYSATGCELVAGIDVSAWLAKVSREIGRDDLHAVFIWPPQVNRGRVYVHLLDRAGHAAAFVKLALDADNRDQLAKESEILTRLAGLEANFKLPRVLSQGQTDNDGGYIVMEPLPASNRCFRPSASQLRQIIEEFSGPVRYAVGDEVRSLPWWCRFKSNCDAGSAFAHEIRSFGDFAGLPLCKVHGDLGPANLIEANGKLWILDWEDSSPCAPRMTDQIAYHLSLHQGEVLHDPRAGVEEFTRQYLTDVTPDRRLEVMMALAYLSSAGRLSANEIIRCWEAGRNSRRLDRATENLISAAPQVTEPPTLAVICNAHSPYRLHLHRRIVRELGDYVTLHTIYTHEVSSTAWASSPPPDIRPVSFGPGEPISHQGKLRYALHEWRKAGRIIQWMKAHRVRAAIVLGYNDVGRIRLLKWLRRNHVPNYLFGDNNIRGDVGGIKGLIKQIFLRAIVPQCTGIMVCGRYGEAYYRKYGARAENIYYVPYEPDYDLIQKLPTDIVDQTRERYGLNKDRRRLIFSGRMVPVKRPDLLIQAFCKIADERPDWDLVMVGTGVLVEGMKLAIPAHLKGRIIWTGFIDDQMRIGALYRALDVLVLPSDFEPWALVINEAVAAGLAVVASDVVGAAAELVQDGINGRIFTAGNLQSLITCLREVTSPDQTDRMKAASAQVLVQWRDRGDPVQGIRQALESSGRL